MQDLLTDPRAADLLRSAHDCSDGGLGVALAEWCIWSDLGITGDLDLALQIGDPAAVLFGEAPSRVLVCVAPDQWETLTALALKYSVPLTWLGEAGGDRVKFARADVALADLRDAWENGLARALQP